MFGVSSRKNSIAIPEGVSITVEEGVVSARGKLGSLCYSFASEDLKVDLIDRLVKVSPLSQTKKARRMWGTDSRQISNIVKGYPKALQKVWRLWGSAIKRLYKEDLFIWLSVFS